MQTPGRTTVLYQRLTGNMGSGQGGGRCVTTEDISMGTCLHTVLPSLDAFWSSPNGGRLWYLAEHAVLHFIA